MNKVKVSPPSKEAWEGYVIESRFKDGRWIYKLSMMEENNEDSFDCWFPEEWLERAR
jgi:hypothetical protein